MLEYAKQHPEKKWVFKPHPMLFKALIDNNVMTTDDAESYYQEWDKIGLKYESGDYNPSVEQLFRISKKLGWIFNINFSEKININETEWIKLNDTNEQENIDDSFEFGECA